MRTLTIIYDDEPNRGFEDTIRRTLPAGDDWIVAEEIFDATLPQRRLTLVRLLKEVPDEPRE